MSGQRHECWPSRPGECQECRSIRAMSRREFMEWFSGKYDRPFCTKNPSHLVGSYMHHKECEPPAPFDYEAFMARSGFRSGV